MSKGGSKPPSQRQLQVGEELRHVIADIFMRQEVYHPTLSSVSLTVSEVHISPDLKNATVYVAPLGGQGDGKALLKALQVVVSEVRRLIAKRMYLRHVPRFTFKLDESFDNAHRIGTLLHAPQVQRDLSKPDDSESSN
ncbi:MAG: 30S ribosome-binding factor RbfA [Alphaproteobacteria bacterium]|nr:30S ribosome-binding factor RbfA [Alphaproteobacteria bacterium]